MKSKESNSSIIMEGTSRYWSPVWGGGGERGEIWGQSNCFQGVTEGGVSWRQQSIKRGYRKLTANQLPLMEGGRVGHKNITEP